MAKEAPVKTGLITGLNHGHVCRTITTTATTTAAKDGLFCREGKSAALSPLPHTRFKTTARVVKPRVSRTKGHLSKRTAFVRDVVKEVSGLAPYERRVIELLRNSKDKRARKLAKKRLGTFGRAKRKVEEMTRVIAESRRVGH
ncbi:ribosomal protein L36e [Colletotrichum lupini]|uniref:60S ribosomal protein L36 n=2 Tax=Colletotrichum acutatum species complex TaxID=2707335 RepID=A0A9Q8WF44_9PEZI|nr:ribosomal protein L36e [Colletotrichum lupini]UQC80497.1 ribosomal protein L36e [Colletotrichum lupini]